MRDTPTLKLAGAEFIPDSTGALFWRAESTLVVADLHFEKGSSFAARGVLLPPFDTRETLDRLEAVVTRFQPRRVIALGDSFHDRAAALRLASSDARRVARLVGTRDWIWIVGNHDPEPPSELGGTIAHSVHIGGLVFRHVPEPFDAGQGEIAGHLHPAARVVVRGRRFRRRCFATDGRRVILPAFGAFTGGLDLATPAFDGLFETGLTAWLLGERRTYPFPIRRGAPAELSNLSVTI